MQYIPDTPTAQPTINHADRVLAKLQAGETLPFQGVVRLVSDLTFMGNLHCNRKLAKEINARKRALSAFIHSKNLKG